MPRLKRTPLKLDLIQSKSLSLPRKYTSAMRASLRSNPTKALNYQVFRDHLTAAMVKSYALGYRSKGASLKRDSKAAKQAEFSKMSRQVLMQYQKYANRELKRTYRKALDDGKTPRQATKAVLRRFNTIGMTAPAYNQMETLFRTASNAAYNQGIWDATRTDPAVWGYQYKTAEDEKVRHPVHSQYNNVTLPKGHPFWQKIWPPIEWNCRCRIKAYKRKQKIKRPPANPAPVDSAYVGQAFELR